MGLPMGPADRSRLVIENHVFIGNRAHTTEVHVLQPGGDVDRVDGPGRLHVEGQQDRSLVGLDEGQVLAVSFRRITPAAGPESS